MPVNCAVCSRNGGNSPGTSFYQIPKNDTVTAREWVRFVKTTRPDFEPTKWSVICGAHFHPECRDTSSLLREQFGMTTTKKLLKKGSIPTVRTTDDTNRGLKKLKNDLERKEKVRQTHPDDETNVPNGDSVVTYTASRTSLRRKKLNNTASVSVTSGLVNKNHENGDESCNPLHLLANYCLSVSKEEVGNETTQITLNEPKNPVKSSDQENCIQPKEKVPPTVVNEKQQTAHTQEDTFWKKYHQLKEEASLYRRACKSAQLLTLSNIKDNDSMFEKYTGIPNYAIFEALYDYLKPNSMRLKRSAGKTFDDKGSNSGQHLTSEEELFLFLVRVKTGSSASDLAVRFGISKPTFNVIFASWAVFLSNKLKDFYKTVIETLNEQAETRVVVDCSTLLWKSMSKLHKDYQMLRLCKESHHRLIIVGLNDKGAVLNVSDTLKGRALADIVSKESTDLTRDHNQYEDFKTDHEPVQIQIELTKGTSFHEVRLKLDLKQSSAKKAARSSKATVHQIEKALTRIKQFRYLKQLVEPSELDTYEQVFKACAYLTNFQTSL